MTTVLVLGCGSIGARHARNLADMGVQLILVDQDEAFAQRLARIVGGQTATRESAPLTDLVVVCTPTASHVQDLGWALERGADVFVEKPLASSRTDMERARELLREHTDRIVMIGCNLRFSEGFRELKANLHRVGKPLVYLLDYGWWLPAWRPDADYRQQYSARRELGGGIVLDAIHEIDYALELLGPVVDARGLCATTGALGIDVEDSADMVLTHQGGMSHIHVDYLRREYSRSCTVVGSDAEITWDVPRRHIRFVQIAGDDPEPILQVDADPNRQYVDEMCHMLQALKTRMPTCNNVDRAAAALDVAFTVLGA